MEDRDKFLTEAMGGCWHEYKNESVCTCGRHFPCVDDVMGNFDLAEHLCVSNTDFSTWAGFGKLWEWAQKKGWWDQFLETVLWSPDHEYRPLEDNIHPDRFANALYSFLKEKS